MGVEEGTGVFLQSIGAKVGLQLGLSLDATPATLGAFVSIFVGAEVSVAIVTEGARVGNNVNP
jgi:hypothetical protein